MSTTASPPTLGDANPRHSPPAGPADRVAYAVSALLAASGVVHLAVLTVSGGSWEGPLSLRKAATFGLSFGLTLATVTWATSFLTMGRRIRTALLGILAVTCIGEVGLVTMQVWRGVPSHFNFETPFDTAVSMTLAAGGGVLIVTALGFTFFALRTAGSPGLVLALRFGFVALLVSLLVGALMIARGVPLARGGQAQLAYDTAGSLKPLHAVALHAVLVVPGVAWLLDRSRLSPRLAVSLVRLTAVLYGLTIVVVAALLIL
jgi:hypothetical protein